MDLAETQDHYELYADIPGETKDAIKLKVGTSSNVWPPCNVAELPNRESVWCLPPLTMKFEDSDLPLSVAPLSAG